MPDREVDVVFETRIPAAEPAGLDVLEVLTVAEECVDAVPGPGRIAVRIGEPGQDVVVLRWVPAHGCAEALVGCRGGRVRGEGQIKEIRPRVDQAVDAHVVGHVDDADDIGEPVVGQRLVPVEVCQQGAGIAERDRGQAGIADLSGERRRGDIGPEPMTVLDLEFDRPGMAGCLIEDLRCAIETQHAACRVLLVQASAGVLIQGVVVEPQRDPVVSSQPLG